MSKTKWNIKEITEKIKYVKERLKSSVSEAERFSLSTALITYVMMLQRSGDIRVKIYNFFNEFSTLKLKREMEYKEAIDFRLLYFDADKIDEEYLAFLIELAEIMNFEIKLDYQDFQKMDFSPEELISISTKLYQKYFDNDEIMKFFYKIYDKDKNYVNFSGIKSNKRVAKEYGACFADHIFDESYVTINGENNLLDAVILSHETMHGIEFYVNPRKEDREYQGFHETTSYTMNNLSHDFLEENGFNSEEINQMRIMDMYMLTRSACCILALTKERLIRENKMQDSDTEIKASDAEEYIMPFDILSFLEIQSRVMAYKLYSDIKLNKEDGISNLKQFMKMKLPKDIIPDFSSIGLSREEILKQAKKIRSKYENSKNISTEGIKSL